MKTYPALGTRVYIETSWGSAYLVGEVVERPRFTPRPRTAAVYVQWLETNAPSLVDIEMLAPLPRLHHGTHNLTRLERDPDTGELRCSTCLWSVFRYSLTECPDQRPLPVKAL